MKQQFFLDGLDCPNCSAKIEREVGALPGVQESHVNLIKQTLTVQLEDGSPDMLSKVETIVHRHEPDVQVSRLGDHAHEGAHNHNHGHVHEEGHDHGHEHGGEEDNRRRLIRLGIGAVIYVVGLILSLSANTNAFLSFSVLAISYLILGFDVLYQAARNIARGRVFDECFLMGLSTLGAFAIGEYPEAVAVMLFYQIGELFQDMAVDRSRKSITDLMDIRPDTATVSKDGKLYTVSPAEVRIGETVLVRPGEKIPLDGIVQSGQSTLDTRALTGESVPKAVQTGDAVLSGCINSQSALLIQVTKSFEDSTASKILDLVENAASRKAPTENFITTFARYYTPVVVILAALLAVVPPLALGGGWVTWIRRSFVFLVISCPCALVISIPLTFFGGIGAASRKGVLVKGSNYLEALGRLDTVVFDKTGTLTQGVFQVTELLPAPGFPADALLEYGALAESLSNHPIARSIVAAYGRTVGGTDVTNYREIPGQGVQAIIRGSMVYAGNQELLSQAGILCDPCNQVGTKVYLSVGGRYAGCIVIADAVKPDSKQALDALKQLGIRKTVMLTGDNETIAKATAQELGLDSYYAQLLPQDKVAKLEQLNRRKPTNAKLAFVGDGINDAPVLARADVGIAMGALGSDAAIEAADVVLMTDEPSKLVEAMVVARTTHKIVMQNILFAIGVKVLFLILGTFGIAGMWEAVFGDVGVMVLAVLNAMRMLRE